MDRYLAPLKKYWIALAAVLIVLLILLGHALGYRLAPGGLVLSGTLQVEGIPEDARVYLDESRLAAVEGGVARATLRPGAHSVIVDIDGMQPWNELVELSSGVVSSLSPIQVPKDLVRTRVAPESVVSARALVRATKVPTEAAPLSLACVNVWVSGSRILASTLEGCEAPAYLACEESAKVEGSCPATLIFAPSAPVRSVVPFPGRTDALVVAAGSLSYVVELDPREPQFFAPLIKAMVTLAPYTDHSLLLEEAGVLYELPL